MRNILLILILFASLLLPNLSPAQVVLKTDSLTVNCISTDTILVPVRVLNFTDVGSFQFTLSWNPQQLDYIATGPLGPEFTSGAVNFGYDTLTYINQGKLTFNWTKFQGGTVPDSTIVFPVAFVRLGGPYSPVAFDNIPVSVEVTDADGNEVPWMVMNGGVKPIDDKAPVVTCPPNVTVSAAGPTPVANIAPVSLTDNCGTPSAGFTVSGATTLNAPTDPDASGTVFNFGQSTVSYLATDVGGNTNACSFTVTVEPLATDDLTLLASNGSASCAQLLSIDITTLNFDSLGSLQFSLGWDPQVFTYQSVSNFNPDMQLAPSNFGTASTGNGFLAFNWTTTFPLSGGTTLPDGALLFTLNLNVVGASGSNSAIQFGDFPAVREAILAENLQEIPFVTIDGQASVIDNTPPNMTCPGNVAVPADAGGTTATVNNLAPLTLSDNCAGNVQLDYSNTGATPGAGQGAANGTYNAGTTMVTYTATDAAGNTATCSFTVTVDAGETLNLTLDSITVDCQGVGDTVSVSVHVENFDNIYGLQFSVAWDETVLSFLNVTDFYPGLGLDASSFLGYVSTPSGLLRFLDGDGTNGWPAIPDGGILFTINFVVLNANATSNIDFIPPFDAVDGTFNSIPITTTSGYFQSSDQTPPVVICPTAQTAIADPSTCMATVSLPPLDAEDFCSGIDGTSQAPPGNVFNLGTTTIFYTATDNSGNTAACSFTLTVTENAPPQLQNCPSDITVNATEPNCQGIAIWTAPTATDNCSQATVLPPNFASGAPFPLGNTTVFYIATDASNNTSSCTFQVTVEDAEAPSITCPADVTVSAISGGTNCEGIATFEDATASDNCDQALDLTSDWVTGDTFPVGTTVVTFEAEDNFANTATCQFNVTVLDDVAPVLVCPDNSIDTSDTNACGANVSWAIPSATDDCDQSVVPTPSPLVQPGDFFPVGTTSITYTAADASGNSSTCSFSITVVETVPPVLTNCPGLIIVLLPPGTCDTVVTWTAPNASDNCALDTVFSDIPSGSTFVPDSTVVTYTAIDEAGNTANCSFLVLVVDPIPPVLGACPPNDTVTVSGSCGVVYPWTLPSVSDNCDPNPSIISQPMPDDTLQVGINTINVYAEDASGNRDTCAFVITVNGSAVPQWTSAPDITVTTDSCSLPVTWTPPTFSGYCDTAIITFNYQPGDVFPVGITTVTYVATDLNGVMTSTDFTITVLEIIPPSLSCPAGISANIGGIVLSDPDEIVQEADTIAGCGGVRLYFNTPIGVDNCTTGVTTVEPTGLTSGDAFPIGVNTVTYLATDASGNTAVCSFTVEVLDLAPLTVNVAPLVACMEGETDTLTAALIPGAEYHWTGPNGNAIPDADNQILVIAGGGNSGTYSVYADLNGCPTPTVSALVVVASALTAMNDTFTLAPGNLDTLDVLGNDIFIPADGGISDYFPSDNNDLLLLPDGTFSYDMGEEPFTFSYLLCSKACPDLCSEATVTIQVITQGCEFIPNIFTPNGDGDHQYFVIPCLEAGTLRESSIVIYNQWGSKVYEAAPYQNAWDGTLDGEPGKDLPDGTYFYIFKPRPNDPPQKGFVEIFR